MNPNTPKTPVLTRVGSITEKLKPSSKYGDEGDDDVQAVGDKQPKLGDLMGAKTKAENAARLKKIAAKRSKMKRVGSADSQEPKRQYKKSGDEV